MKIKSYNKILTEEINDYYSCFSKSFMEREAVKEKIKNTAEELLDLVYKENNFYAPKLDSTFFQETNIVNIHLDYLSTYVGTPAFSVLLNNKYPIFTSALRLTNTNFTDLSHNHYRFELGACTGQNVSIIEEIKDDRIKSDGFSQFKSYRKIMDTRGMLLKALIANADLSTEEFAIKIPAISFFYTKVGL